MFYHGTDLSSARALFGGAPLDVAKAAARKIDGAPGFFLATDADAAMYFALRRSPGAILKYEMTPNAAASLASKGAVLRNIPAGGMKGGFPGQEFFVPTGAFERFNELARTGQIIVLPF